VSANFLNRRSDAVGVLGWCSNEVGASEVAVVYDRGRPLRFDLCRCDGMFLTMWAESLSRPLVSVE
jgi:hypothetical protein